MTAVLTRILARYLAGALVFYGLIDPDSGAELAVDPDVALLIGLLIGAITEGAYALARRWGWAT